jgi:hypothetical protein
VKRRKLAFSADDAAFWVLSAAAILLYLVWPLTHLEAYAWSNDEGLYLQRAALANAGYELYGEIAFNKPPLLIWVLQLAFIVGGQTLASARLACLALSLLGMLSLSVLIAQMWGRWAGLATAWLVLAFPDVPVRAHAVMSDWPAMAFALVALCAALAFRHRRERRWLILAGGAFSAALLIHPLLVYTGVPLAVLLLLPGIGRSRARWGDAVLLCGVGAAMAIAVLIAVDCQELLTWVVGHNVSGVGAGVEISKPGALRLAEFPRQNPALVLLAAVGAVALGAERRWRTLAVVGVWIVATAIVFLAWTPIWGHYTLFLSLPLAGLAGTGLARAGGCFSKAVRRRAGISRLQWLLGAVAVVGLGAVVVGRLGAEAFHTEGGPEWAPERLAVISFLEETVPEEGFVVTDDPLLAFMADRLVPPDLTEVSLRQVLLGSLTAEDVVLSVLRSETEAVVFATNRLARLTLFDRWVAGVASERLDFGCVWIPTWGCRPLWGYRLQLGGAPGSVVQAVLGETIALEGCDVATDSVRAGDTVSIVAYWKSLGPVLLDYSAYLRLIDGDGRVAAQTYSATLKGTLRSSRWPEGLLLPDPHTLEVPAGLEPGRYTLTVALCLAPDNCAPARSVDGVPWSDGHVVLANLTVAEGE